MLLTIASNANRGSAEKLLPRGIVAEGVPLRVEIRRIGKAEHVGQAGHALPDQRVAEKDHLKSGVLENLEFARMEHLHFAQRGPDNWGSRKCEAERCVCLRAGGVMRGQPSKATSSEASIRRNAGDEAGALQKGSAAFT